MSEETREEKETRLDKKWRERLANNPIYKMTKEEYKEHREKEWQEWQKRQRDMEIELDRLELENAKQIVHWIKALTKNPDDQTATASLVEIFRSYNKGVRIAYEANRRFP